MAVGGRLVWDDSAFQELLQSEHGPVAKYLEKIGEVVTQGAKRRCRVSLDGSHGRPSGYTRSKIGFHVGKDSEGLYVTIESPATSPEGYPIGYGLEVGTKPHIIMSHGPYPLRDKRGNVFGRIVHHPGTPPFPHLRPALDDVRGL